MQGQIGPFIILLVLLGGIIFYVISINPVEREAIIGPILYERYVLDTQPGLVEATPLTTYKVSKDLGISYLDYSPIPTPKILSEQISIKRSATTNTQTAFPVNINKQELTAASLDFNIASKLGNAGLTVTLNGIVVFTGNLEPGRQSIDLPLDVLQQGPNEIIISVAPPGIAFWRSTTYVLTDVEFVSKNYMPERAVSEQIVTLTPQELTGLISARLDAYAKQLSAKPATITLKFNDKQLYSAIPTDERLRIDLPPVLVQTTNKLNWAVARDGKYDIIFGKLTITYAKAPYKVKSWTFAITDFEISASKTGQINCLLQVTAATDVTKLLTFQINAQTVSIEMKDGKIEENICRYLQPGDNYLAVYSPSDIKLDKLSILIKGKA